jgi:TRAP-type C4-dicarboxylate transport system permease large subunit
MSKDKFFWSDEASLMHSFNAWSKVFLLGTPVRKSTNASVLMGMFPALTVVIPLITPVAQAYGIHPLHLGIIFLTNLEIGASIPPLGINLFISSIRFEKPVLTLYMASLPFIIILLVGLAIITYLPWLSLVLTGGP